MTSLLVTGYKSFELGIFKDKDPKVTIIKKAIKRDFKRFLDDGVDWMIFTGNLGFEFWRRRNTRRPQARGDAP